MLHPLASLRLKRPHLELKRLSLSLSGLPAGEAQTYDHLLIALSCIIKIHSLNLPKLKISFSILFFFLLFMFHCHLFSVPHEAMTYY